MKKLLITLGLAAVAAGAFAQGTVNPANTAGTLFHTNAPVNNAGVIPGVGNTGPALGGFYYEVLTAPSSVTTVDSSLQGLLSGPWSDTGLRLTNTTFATGGHVSGPSGTAGVVANWPNARQSYIIVGWSATEGATTWTGISAQLAGATFSGGKWTGGLLVPGGFVGATTIQAAVSGTPAGIGTFSLFGAGTNVNGSPIVTPTDLFLVDAVPEPTSFALVGLGAAALMIFRRRK
jgi:hypothetical protein